MNNRHPNQPQTGAPALGAGEPAERVQLGEGEGAVDFDVARVGGPVRVEEGADGVFGVPGGEEVVVWGWVWGVGLLLGGEFDVGYGG